MELKFMDNTKNDKYYIEKVKENINAIIDYTANKSYEEFVFDGCLIDATMFRLIQMIENLNQISNEYREKHPKIAWKQIIGFRNKIVHDYGKTDYSIVYEIVSSDIYQLKDELL